MQDRLLLRRFVERGSQAAFAEVVGRYMRLVYATCLREVGDRQMAEDVTQGVFLILAQKAPALGGHVPLAGWLFRTARLASRSAMRQERRRRHWEQAAAEAGDDWEASVPRPRDASLNEALAALKPGEREAVLLRFFEEMSFAEVGAALGLSEDTAQKRVSRALDKMRAHLARHGEALSAAALLGLLSDDAVRSVPASCATPLLQIIPGLKIALETSGLFGARAYQISQGVLRTMKAKVTLTAASVGVLAVASAAVLMAGTAKTSGSIVGAWKGKIIVPPLNVGVRGISTCDTTWHFNSDGTFRTWGGYAVWTGRYKLTGNRLTNQDLQQVVYHTDIYTSEQVGRRAIISPPTAEPHGYPENRYPANLLETYMVAFSDGGKRMTITDTHKGRSSVVLMRQ